MFGPNAVVAELACNHTHLYHGKCIFLKTDKGKLTNHGLPQFSFAEKLSCLNNLLEATVWRQTSVYTSLKWCTLQRGLLQV